jgi:hypothetical protein
LEAAAFLGAAWAGVAVAVVLVLAAPAFREVTAEEVDLLALALAAVALLSLAVLAFVTEALLAVNVLALAGGALLSADVLVLAVLVLAAGRGLVVAFLGLAAAALPVLAVALVGAFVALGAAFFTGVFAPAAFRGGCFSAGVAGLKSSNNEFTSFFTFLTALVTASGIKGLGLFLVLGIVLLFSGKQCRALGA